MSDVTHPDPDAAREAPSSVATTDAVDPLALWRATPFARREFERWPVSREARASAAGQALKCRIRDLSPAGARFSAGDLGRLGPGRYVVLDLDGYRTLAAEIRYVDVQADEVGVMFLLSPSGRAELAAWLAEQPQGPKLH